MNRSKDIKEVTVFTKGDASKLRTWSNVPYFFTHTLEEKGIIVRRVAIETNPRLERIFTKTIYRIYSKLFPGTTYSFQRSFLHYIAVRRSIKKAIKKYPATDVFYFMTFSFSSIGLSKKPCVMICDWTYEYYFKYFVERAPDTLERTAIARENKQIRDSDLTVPLFPGVAEFLQHTKHMDKVHYFGHIINSLESCNVQEVLETKQHATSIVFIGSKKYLQGAEVLIQSFQQLKKRYPQLTLHIIGMDGDGFSELPESIEFHGYLDKEIPSERATYYNILREAKFMVNTTPKWGAFSATVEAMYFCNPVIVAPYREFVKTFGTEISFGSFCEENTTEVLASLMEQLLLHSEYKAVCTAAHQAVSSFTWNTFVDRVLTHTQKNL
ncbi:glycosyltransferase [Altibacter sp. HG106]|uniref:glycosyltransferase n=1 Tax=Altibacter sp. HG106 TaxID=3023937 RepID=UPI0023504E81|nr:glycosyltransferase [Altibacter sp. HG106]MDC7995708.1 glycosyltransferase [Altibacter sp. HG106]